MNTSALKSFAPAVRRQLMEAVSRKLDVVLAAQTPDYRTTYARQVAALGKRAEADRQGLVERVAYTWFNRLAALRYLDARGWHPFRANVLMPATAEETQPEVLRLLRTGALPADLKAHVDEARLHDLLDGRIPSPDPQGEAYRYLVLGACRFYHALLPDLFEKLDDETELLLPDDLLTEHSVAHGFRTEITDDDCAEVEVLGWLYQFYISEKKDAVMAHKKAVPSEDIPAVTQLFTPHWIVRYLVENSLGRLWLLNRPGSRLREQMPYYIEGEPEEDFLRIERPEEIRLIDPAVGSGHMLVYAFDLLYAIYEEAGYAPSEIAGLILTHNLYGVDIDPRAAQLASLALVLKARERSRRFFQSGVRVRPNVIALEDVRFDDAELREYVRALAQLGELFDAPVLELLGQFENATTFGSLIQPVLDEDEIRQLRRRIEEREVEGDLLLSGTHQKVLRVLEQAEYLTQRYQIAVANPPYMGAGAMPGPLKRFVEQNYLRAKENSFAAFIDQAHALTLNDGYSALVTMQAWMFLARYTAFRKELLSTRRIVSLLQLGAGAFEAIQGEVVSTCAFVLSSGGRLDASGKYVRLTDVSYNGGLHADVLSKVPRFDVPGNDLRALPAHALAFWLSPELRKAYQSRVSVADIAEPRKGMVTADNARFIRLWSEVSLSRIGFGNASRDEAKRSARRWFPYQKGGSSRRWYGNQEHVVNWENDGAKLLNMRAEGYKVGSTNHNLDYIFKPAVVWTKISSGVPGFRASEHGFLFDDAAGLCPTRTGTHAETLLAFFNSVCARAFLEAANPTLNLQPGNLASLPWRAVPPHRLFTELLTIARSDWDNSETSWDFRDLPLLRPGLKGTTLAESWQKWQCHTDAAIRRMQELETENNRLWIEAYGLQDELSSEVPEDQITLARADQRKDVAAFLSYAVGCMMGRYSLDAPGLVLADAGSTVEQYLEKVGKPLEELTFAPDADGIVPVLDGEWFEDDIVARTRDFLRATFGEATLRENLRFIEESLGKELRRYFLTDFYKDHLQTYKKRPIYWMVQSPKKGFGALIYLHRYTRDTMNLVLNRYLREYQARLRDRLAHLARVQANPDRSAREQTAARKESDKLTRILHECEEWERQTLLPLAQARVELDLDDGVKVNYLKLGEALAPIPGLAAKGDD